MAPLARPRGRRQASPEDSTAVEPVTWRVLVAGARDTTTTAAVVGAWDIPIA
jgi:hypothetical protein